MPEFFVPDQKELPKLAKLYSGTIYYCNDSQHLWNIEAFFCYEFLTLSGSYCSLSAVHLRVSKDE